MAGLNWSRQNERRRMRDHGTESIGGERSMPASHATDPQPKRTQQASKLPEPVEVAKFWRNRRGEAVIVQLREYEGHVLIDARVHFTNPEGKLQATAKGLSLAIRRLPELAAALAKAERKARELGFLEGAADE